ncbi:sensor protein DivL [Roseovarius sp. A-2]|uniref:hybrid sensor histidine kinase/response regulator n=1 Tax=Roseovarius sp. A-2 TaxID=1570360 RepID=UPI0009B55FD9|nr:PAS-domain containing protein [Roseovarius sp. A-2]GAW33973.1 sensor protein DivL [Roseovarius sp. A-2]
MIGSLLDPRDPPERQIEKLLKIAAALMRRVEDSTNASGAAYAQFQRAAMLEQEVQARTRDLERALDLLNDSNARLSQAHAETEAARSNLANAIETVQEGFALFDPAGALVMCNSRFGMHMPDIRERLKPGLSFTDYVHLVSRSRHLALTETLSPAQWAARRMQRHADDHVIFNVGMTQNRWVQVSEHRTGDGGTVVLQTDITDIMRLERQARDRLLDDQARLIRATLEHLNQGLCIFDSAGRLVGWNSLASELLAVPAHRFRTGAEFETLFGRLREDALRDPTLGARDIATWVARNGTRPPLSFEIRRGRDRILSLFGQDMPDHGFVISLTDVTAERRAVQAIYEANATLEARVAERTRALEAALQEAERANAGKSRFVAAASHDLLQPLSAAKLYMAALQGAVPDAAAQTILEKAQNALGSVEHILEALLDISKLDSGNAAVHVAPVPLGLILAQLHDELGPVAAQKGLDLRVVGTSAIVCSDMTYLRRIVQNLLSNAIRYTGSGRVLIGLRRQARKVRLEIRDTGPGIPADKQDVIFREFHRLDADASAAEGMGLGLAIVERACSLLMHPLRLWSEPGLGTCFSVELPLVAQSDLKAPAPEPPGTAPQADLGAIIALLIENDAPLRNAITVTLETWGVHVLDCASGAEAIALLQEIGVAPDAIIADYQLDNGSLGTDAVRDLRAIHGPIPACIVSADRSRELREHCASAGLDVLHKPLDPNELRAFLRQCA